MATFRADFQREEKQNCPICLGDFKIPRQLPCMHSFCEKCLQGCFISQEKKLKKLKQIKCPICRQDVCIAQQGKPGQTLASLFPIDVIFQSIVSDTKEKVDHSCDSCHSAGISRPGEGFCVECEEAMCRHCSEVHQKQKISRNHVIISLQEFNDNPHNVMKIAKGFGCSEHEGEAIAFFCKDHRTACCRKCRIIMHRNCSHVSDLKKELPSLKREKNPDNIIDQMKMLKTHLKRFKEVNETNTSLIESQVNSLISQIRELRKKLNDALDDLEKRVTMEGSRIYNEKMVAKQDENHRCQSMISSIRNSHILLETVQKYGTETQVFLMTEKITSQLKSYMDQIQKKYTATETTTVLLEVSSQVQSILTARPDSFGKIICRQELQSLPVPVSRKPFRNCLDMINKIIEIKGNDDSLPNYVGVINLYSGHVMLADFRNDRVCLLDSSYNSVTSYNLPSGLYNICIVDDNEVAVTFPRMKTVQFLSVRNEKITPTRTITTRYSCGGVASAGKGNIVVSGICDDGDKYYWSLINSEGKEESCHQFDCQCVMSCSHVAMNSSFTLIYITVNKAHSLYCFDMTGCHKFVYRHEKLTNPRCVATDRYDNVYVVGSTSNNIHQLTPDGVVLQILTGGVPARPKAICVSRDGEEILVTSESERRTLYQYRLK